MTDPKFNDFSMIFSLYANFKRFSWSSIIFHDLETDMNLNYFSRAAGPCASPWQRSERLGRDIRLGKTVKSIKVAKFRACIIGKGCTQTISQLRSILLQVLPPHPEHILVHFTSAFLHLQFLMQAVLLSIYMLKRYDHDSHGREAWRVRVG